jgi:hypothetical protein
MKRFVSLIIAALCLFSLAACTGGKPEPAEETAKPTASNTESAAPEETPVPTEEPFVYDPETDFDNRIAKLGYISYVELPESYVFVFDGSPIMYWEKDVEDGGVLCNKPECDHHNSECSAYISVFGNINYYKGRIYWLTYGEEPVSKMFYYSIMSMKPDSTDRREEMRFYRTDEEYIYAKNLFIHRGVAFLYYKDQKVENAVPSNVYRVDAVTLGSDDKKTIYKLETTSYQEPLIQFRGNKAYIARGRGGDELSYIEMTVYNVVSGAVEETEYEVELPEAWLYDFYLTPEGEPLFAFESDYETYSARAFAIEDGRAVERIAFEDGEHFFSAGFADGLVCANFMIDRDPDRMLYWITDFEGNTVYKGYLPMEYRKSIEETHTFGGRDFLVGSGSSFIVMTKEDVPFGEIWFLVKYDVSEDGLTETVLGTFEMKTQADQG